MSHVSVVLVNSTLCPSDGTFADNFCMQTSCSTAGLLSTSKLLSFADVSTADIHVSEHVAGQVRTNWVGLIDEWATRFFHELDYEREAQNGMLFKEQMASLDGIVVADVYQHLSNKQVLTTVWVQGQSSCITHMWSGHKVTQLASHMYSSCSHAAGCIIH